MTCNDLAIYIHWPFCKSKCPYCDFNSHVRENIDEQRLNKAYMTSVDYYSDYLKNKRITSIFYGGGTPTLMPPVIVSNIIEKIASYADLSSDIEITLEANPTSTEAKKLLDFKNAGINRLSLGIQSLIDKDLKFLGREHSANEAINAIKAAQIFENYSFDLIYGRPNQTLNDWEKELNNALNFTANHLSLYQLTIEKGTSFYNDHKSGKFIMPDNESLADFYELTNHIMVKNNFNCYEISNYATTGYESKHNMAYWRYKNYLGLGAGAHSRINDNSGSTKAIMMIHSPEYWLESVENKKAGVQSQTTLSQKEILDEFILMGLRLSEGININRLKEIAKKDFLAIKNNIDKYTKLSMLETEGDFIKTSNKGKFLLNMLTEKILTY